MAELELKGPSKLKARCCTVTKTIVLEDARRSFLICFAYPGAREILEKFLQSAETSDDTLLICGASLIWQAGIFSVGISATRSGCFQQSTYREFLTKEESADLLAVLKERVKTL